MLKGHIDALTSNGFIRGWAFDTEAPSTPLRVMIVGSAGEVIAEGLAHHYRDDLVAAGCGIGWCEFRLRVETISRLRRIKLYVLGRPADFSGLRHYTRLIRSGDLKPFDLLAALADSPEFRSRPRLLGAPNSATFPLSCA